MKNKDHYKILVERYLSGELTKEELVLFMQLTKKGVLDEHLQAAMDKDLPDSLPQSIPVNKPFYKTTSFHWIAATILITLLISIFLIPNKTDLQRYPTNAAAVQPGSNKATLTLANGEQILLDTTHRAGFEHIPSIDDQQSKTGALVYRAQKNSAGALVYNTLTVPENGQFHMVLSDGSKIWLNAASSLKYPIAFDTKERIVELIGEAYFEIAPDVNRPFLVKTANQQVNVLGTDFNLMAYPDEDVIETALISGKVQVRDTTFHNPIVLTPGTKLRFNKRTAKRNTETFDPEEVIAWKNGNFLFNETPLKEILPKLARWYAVKIDASYLPDIRYNGFISRNVPLSKVLKMMEETGDIKFAFEGNTIKIDNQMKLPM
ncbi:hypothetical protein GCM10023231_33590 [Olivibacter ginsenosidimutans]|uniref:DUF4974 domain-containing protein n=1 Tax=Olivibacter ginsenosidimutans TaxID=1176537 RepID=A0ABP9BYI5_9SPHI